jgi:hypothetical protein
MIYKIFFFLLGLSCFVKLAKGQPYLVNGDFSQWDQTSKVIGGCSTSFYDHDGPQSMPNWKRSHGTPQAFYPPDSKLNYIYAFMWARKSGAFKGEGIFAGYNFLPNRTYKVAIRAQSNNVSGTLKVFATNGLEEWSDECGDPLPSPTTSIPIGNISTLSNGWADFELFFNTNTNSYSQICCILT